MNESQAGDASVEQNGRSWKDAITGNVLMMGLVSLFTDFSSEMLNPILPIFFAGLAGGAQAAFWVGLSEGIAETTAALLKIFSGRISDRLGKRKALVIVGYGLSSVCRPAIALVSSGIAGAIQVVGLKFGDRVGKGIRTSPRDALIGDSVGPKHRGLAFSFHRLMDHTGAVLGPLVVLVVLWGVFDLQLWGRESAGGEVTDEQMTAMRWLFGIAVIPGALAMLSLVTRVREIAPNREQRKCQSEAEEQSKPRLPGRFYGFVAIVTLFALGNSSDMFLLLYGWRLLDIGLLQIPLLWIALHLSKIVFSVPGGVLSDRLGRRPIMVAGWTVYMLVYLGMAYLGYAKEQGTPIAAWHFWALFLAYGFYYGMTEGVEKALVTDFIPSERRGTAFGIYHGAVGLAALPASLLFGVFWMQIGPVVAFSIGAGIAAAATVALIVLLSATRRRME